MEPTTLYFYNASGAAVAVGRSISTISAAIESGELTTSASIRGGGEVLARLISVEDLEAYRDRLVARLDTYEDVESKDEAKRLRKLKF